MKQYQLTILVESEQEEIIENLIDLFGDIIDLSADVSFYASWFDDITDDEDDSLEEQEGAIGG